MRKTLLLIASFTAGLFAVQQAKAQFMVVDTVPLIIHVVHNGETLGTGHNLSQAQILSQFQVLNADFAGQGWNVGNVPPVWASLVANTGIVFVPAVVDTNGIPLAEPGIDRIDRNSMSWMNTSSMSSSSLQNYVDNTIKPQSIWNHNNYCNVWLLDMTGSGLLGYSTLPANSGLPWITPVMPTATASNDGVCVHYKCWGDTLNVVAPYDHGRTATHEFGHWLGLRHMMGGCVAQDVADLPIGEYNQWMTSPVFPDVADSCAGYPDGPMFMNFMCYAISDSDIYMFTADQGNAMRQGLTNGHGSVTNSDVWHLTSVKQVTRQEKGFVIFPNPTSGVLHLKANAAYKEVSIKVFNAIGQTIIEQHLDDWLGTYSLSLSRQKSGMYFVSVTTDGKTTIQKIVLE
jgi:hypothetical protein